MSNHKMMKKKKATDNEQHYLTTITSRRQLRDGRVEYFVHWEGGSQTWEPRETLIQEAWTKVSLFEMTLPKEEQMVEFKVKAILDDRPLLGRAAVEAAAAAAGGGGGGESKNSGERLYLTEWEDSSRTWEPRGNLETDGVMTTALLDYLGLPMAITNPKQHSAFGVGIIPDPFAHIHSPLPIYTVQLVTEEKKTGDEFQVLLSTMPKLRPNIRVLSPRIINNWTGASGVVAMDLCSDNSDNNNNSDDVIMTDVNTKTVAAKVSDDHKVPHLTIAVIHGDRNRERGKLFTAQGSLDLSIVLGHLKSRILVLLQCCAGHDLLEPICDRTRLQKDNGVLLIDPMGQSFVASQVWSLLQHAVGEWVGHEKTWMEALAKLPQSNHIRWWWVENGAVYSPRFISPCPMCGHKILKDMKPANMHVRRFCSGCSFTYFSM